MRPLVIINKAAARARDAWPIVRRRLEESGVAFDFVETTSPGDAAVHARAAYGNGSSVVAVVGGDGTLSEAAAGYFNIVKEDSLRAINPSAALAILPSGTGNDFARTLTDERKPLNFWIDSFIDYCRDPKEKRTRVIDVIRVRTDGFRRSLICINASTLGLGGETASRVAAQGASIRKLSGELRFVTAAMGALAAWRERPMKVRINESVLIRKPMNLIAVANARFAGGGMMLSPTAELDDGELDVVTVSGLSRSGIVRELTRIHKGGHVANPKVRIDKGTSVSIETESPDDALLIEVDGNVSGRTPADYRIMKKCLRVVVPNETAAD